MTEKQILNNKRQREMTFDFIEGLKTNCVKCGESRKYVIDFHHVDNSTKSFDICYGSKSKGRKTIKREIEKCVCLCKNCHTEFHYIYGWNPENPTVALDDYLR